MSDTYVATCPDCDNKMTQGCGCSVKKLVPIQDSVDRIPYNDPREGEFLAAVCHDCAVGPGQYHHLGCDVERCPLCLGQLISCGHVFVPYSEDK